MIANDGRADGQLGDKKDVLYDLILLETREVVRKTLARMIALYERYPSEALREAILRYRTSSTGWRIGG